MLPARPINKLPLETCYPLKKKIQLKNWGGSALIQKLIRGNGQGMKTICTDNK